MGVSLAERANGNETIADGTAPAVAVRDLWFSYDAKRPTLKGIDLRVERGAVCMVLGSSGSGKTTLLKTIKGLVRPERGTVHVFGTEIGSGRGRAGREIAYIPQHLGLVQNLTVLENALTGALGRMGTLPSLLKAFPKELTDEAHSVLEFLRIPDKANMKVHSLSGGERQRVAVARALMQHAHLVLADEFVSQLDPVRAGEVMDAVRSIARRGTTFLITSHEIDLVGRFGDHALFLRHGEKVYDGAATHVDLRLAERLMQ